MNINKPLSHQGNYSAQGPLNAQGSSDANRAHALQQDNAEVQSRWSPDSEDVGYRNAAYLKLKSSLTFKELKPVAAKAKALLPVPDKGKKAEAPAEAPATKTDNNAPKLPLSGLRPLENPGKAPHPRLGRISQPYNPQHIASFSNNKNRTQK